MSDLISRSKLIEEINELLKSPYANQQQFGAERRETIEIVRDLCVKNQPTAYDIDKVVEELNELPIKAIDRYKGGVFGNWEGTDYYINKNNAIEIVKQGGVGKEL